MKLFKIEDINSKKNLAGACDRCNKSKSAKMGIWILKGFLGKSKILWIIRWIICIIIIFALIYLLTKVFQNNDIQNIIQMIINIIKKG